MGLFSHRNASSTARIGTILIVEDEPLVAFENEHALAQAGYHVIATVDRYEDAVAAMDAGGVDLVVSDIQLAGSGSGIDVARHAGRLNLPVLFSTASCPVDAADLSLGCIAKPYSSRHLVRAIRAIEQVLSGGEPPAVPEMMRLFPASD